MYFFNDINYNYTFNQLPAGNENWESLNSQYYEFEM